MGRFKGKRPIRCLLLIHGIPLRVEPPALDLEETATLQILEGRREALRRKIDELGAQEKEQRERLEQRSSEIDAEISRVRKRDHSAAVDSEIALVAAGPYDLAGWMANPFFIGNQNRELAIDKSTALITARLDGPDAATVRRMIDDSLAAERAGLSGTAYFDARWPEPKSPPMGGYDFYDASLHRAARLVERSGRMPVKIEDSERLFQPGDCPDAALYCGWYSHARYVDAFSWRPGSVGYHIASSECTTLRRKGSSVWCKRMLEEGAAAVIGPVEEPYVQAFPVPEVFFGLLIEGYLTLSECYAVSLPHLSWRMVLVGDPLYRPFMRKETR